MYITQWAHVATNPGGSRCMILNMNYSNYMELTSEEEF